MTALSSPQHNTPDQTCKPYPDGVAEALCARFAGFEDAHTRFSPRGTNDRGKVEGNTVTTRGSAPSVEIWRTHLSGSGPSLGVVPLRNDGETVLWGAIDVDVYDQDAGVMADQAIDRMHRADMPNKLSVCRSKSDGLHAFVFFASPKPAAAVQRILGMWARYIGHPDAEIFPKQTARRGDDVGNALNMPFAAGRESYRSDGSWHEPERLLADAAEISDEEFAAALAAAPEEAIKDGQPAAADRTFAGINEYLTSRGGSLRRSGSSYEEILAALRAINEAADHPVFGNRRLDDKEIRSIAKSVSGYEQGDDSVISRTDPLGTAKRYASEHDVVHHRDDFHVHAGDRYERQSNGDMRARLYGWLQHCRVHGENGGTRPFKPRKGDVGQVADALAAEVHESDRRDVPMWLDGRTEPDPAHIVAVENGLLIPATRELIPHTPAFFSHTVSPVAYDPKAAPPDEFLRFLDTQWADDPDSIRTLRQIFGLFLTANTSFQKIWAIIGPPRSGKGTIGRTLDALIGRDNVAKPSLDQLTMNFGMAPLIGRSVATINDARLRRPSGPLVERLLNTSGEDEQTIDRKYRDPWVGKLPTRLMIMSNEIPQLADPSCAVASRFIMLSMPKSFLGEEDRGLWGRISGEMPGVLNWALDGLDDLEDVGRFEQPESGAELLTTLEELSSPIRAFGRECCDFGPGCEDTTDRLWQAWEAWLTDRERPNTLNKDWFVRDLRAAFAGLREKRFGGEDRPRGLVGIQVKVAEPSAWDDVPGLEGPF